MILIYDIFLPDEHPSLIWEVTLVEWYYRELRDMIFCYALEPEFFIRKERNYALLF